MSLRPEQLRALAYLRTRGTEAQVESIRTRVARTYAELEALVEAIPAQVAREHRSTSAWSIHEVIDHLIESERQAIDQLTRLFAGQDVEEPIPASLQSAHPLDLDWPALRQQLRAIHQTLLDLLAKASDDLPVAATAAVQMVIKCAGADGELTPVTWVEHFDWKAYSIALHAHNREHMAQIQRIVNTTPPGWPGIA